MTSITNSAINVIIQNPDTINIIKDLLLPIIGVIIGGLITLWATSVSNKKMIKYQQENIVLNDIIKLVDRLINELLDLSFLNKLNSKDILILHNELSIYFTQYFFFPKNIKKYYSKVDRDATELISNFFQYNKKYESLLNNNNGGSEVNILESDEFKHIFNIFYDEKQNLIKDLLELKIHINNYIFNVHIIMI